MSTPLPPTEADSPVTTEPQRQALDAMSQELVHKLNIMVAEQEERAREFTARQHSLSSLPQTPPFTTDDTPSPVAPPPAAQQKKVVIPPPLATRQQSLPTPPPHRATPTVEEFSEYLYAHRKKESEKGVNVGAFPIILAIIIGLIILRSCGA